ncbi:SMI1/KNR4 family protein [Nonomuraea gerenzanensis]|uniref:SMI1/KNR4 family protein n=1 Tax=Nonomuraea gerenzanensis TaxID=93944 RepID=UPI001CD9614E|nr:SMI1/KNR4 family protein [Nonomuraea gerenzanensis]UBU16737.1 SMI1/KNR4 family protein [Nonomuraea gerenzanensis]
MLKLVRLALTAAILTAIAVRLRRRARMPERRPAPRPQAPAVRRTRMGLVWAAIAAIVAVTLAAALVPGGSGRATPAPTGPPRAMTQEEARLAALWAQTHGHGPSPSPVPAPVEIPDPHCSPAPRPVTVRPIDPKVKRAVDRQWRRIERWLRANAPRTYRTLGKPGRARTIAIAEAQMGVDLPDDLRASLLRHNGSRGAWGFGFGAWFYGASNLGIREIRDTWRDMCRLDPTDRGDDPWAEIWNGRLVPFLSFAELEDGSSQWAVVDVADGAVGWDDTIAGLAPRMPSYYALMRAVADALEKGTEFDGWRPAVKRGVLRWENVEYGNP